MPAQPLPQPPLANEQGRRFQLGRFGYSADRNALEAPSPDAEWLILKADFLTSERRHVPDLSDFPADIRLIAEEHIANRRQLDLLMEACDAAHLTIRDRGADADLVERYAEARDAYEDAVEMFGEGRVRLEKALGG